MPTRKDAAKKRIVKYFPPKNFEELLVDLTSLYRQNSWKYGDMDADKLQKGYDEQTAERQEDQRLEKAYTEHHIMFGKNQVERFAVYMQAIEFARAANRNNKEVLKSLQRFRATKGRPMPVKEQG